MVENYGGLKGHLGQMVDTAWKEIESAGGPFLGPVPLSFITPPIGGFLGSKQALG